MSGKRAEISLRAAREKQQNGNRVIKTGPDMIRAREGLNVNSEL